MDVYTDSFAYTPAVPMNQGNPNNGQAYPEQYDYSAAYRDDYGDDYYEENGYNTSNNYASYDDNASREEKLSDDTSNKDRERDRDRSRRRQRDRRREKRHDKDRSSRDRPRDRDRDRERGRDRDRRDRDRDRSSHRDDDRYDMDDGSNDSRDVGYERTHSREARDREDRGGEKWMTDTPTNTVLLRGLPPIIEEKDIRAELMLFGVPIKDVRLMRKSTGSSRGFAFVEFQSIADAQRWMDQNQGQLSLQNQYTASMHYSTPKTGPEKGPVHKMDWTCSKCGVHNFKRRDHCFKCNLSREESDRKQEGDGFDQVGTNPCNTLILRGLDALTTEENLIHALSQVTSTPMKNVRVIRDELTNTSRGYGFLELNTVAESTLLLDTLTQLQSAFEVDGKQIMVHFAKNTFSTVMATLKTGFSTDQQGNWEYNQQQGYYEGQQYYQGTEYDQSQYNQYYEGQNYDYSQYYNQQSGGQASTASAAPTQTDTTNAAAAVAQAAIQQANAAKFQKQRQQKMAATTSQPSHQNQTEDWNKTAATTAATAQTPASQGDYPKYPPPDVSTYQYEETSGYYYDSSTGLYYDANSQYYYNAQTAQFLYWDAEKSTYLPAPTGDDGTQKEEGGDRKKDKDKKEKVKIAKKIAKDMEKWAKTLNAQKEAIKGFNKTLQIVNPPIQVASLSIPTGRLLLERESATADAGYAILEKSAKGSLDEKKVMPPPPVKNATGGAAAAASALVASYGGDSDSDDDDAITSGGQVDESKLTDWSKLACLLCKRQFQTKEILTKHTQMSDLHKQNLEALYRAKGQSSGSGADSEKLQYRDRAKERRQKYGVPPPPEPKNKRMETPVIPEQPTKAGIGQDNIGNKLLQKMGWSAGQGLGKAGQGIVNPIEAQRRQQTAGLGMRGSSYGATAGDNYREAVKKTMYARFQETD